MKAEIEILRPGLFSTIQDMGRTGFLKYGVPLSGTMDHYAAKVGNLLLRNPEGAAVLEVTLTGPEMLFHGPAKIVVSGANLSPKINGKAIENNSVINIEAGDLFSFGKRLFGCRAYVAISGGFQTEKFLGSRSWYEGLTAQYKLEREDKLQFALNQEELVEVQAALKVDESYMDQQEIPAFEGPEFHLLSKEEKEIIKSFRFSIGKNANRMAIQLKEEFKNSLKPILTGPVLPGTVQLTPSGKLIVLMRDCQTTGGYPRVLQVSEEALNALAQKIMGDEIVFRISI